MEQPTEQLQSAPIATAPRLEFAGSLRTRLLAI